MSEISDADGRESRPGPGHRAVFGYGPVGSRRRVLGDLLPKPALDGSWQITLAPLELLDRLARFIPAPRRHLPRYHGVFAPHAAPAPTPDDLADQRRDAIDDSDSATMYPNPATEFMPDDESQRQDLSWQVWAGVRSDCPDATPLTRRRGRSAAWWRWRPMSVSVAISTR